jgi:hypothetical protein
LGGRGKSIKSSRSALAHCEFGR